MADIRIAQAGDTFSGKMPWDERARRIADLFPSTIYLDWVEIFKQDPAVLGRVISDIFKLEASSDGRPGKRPAVNRKDAEQYLRTYENDDYSILPFDESFVILKGDKSFRGLANKCNLSLNMTQRLLDGRAAPTAEIMEKVAKGFKKHPSYFIEYRIGYVLGILAQRMLDIPEASIVPYRNVRGHYERGGK